MAQVLGSVFWSNLIIFVIVFDTVFCRFFVLWAIILEAWGQLGRLLGTLEASSGTLGWPRSLLHRFLWDFCVRCGDPGHSFSSLFEYVFLSVFRDVSGTAFLSIWVHFGSHFGVILSLFGDPWDL